MKLRQGLGALAAPALRRSVVAALSLLCLIAWGCRQVPLGEKRIGLSPDAPLIGMSEAEEIQLGIDAYSGVLQEEPLSTNQRYVDMVRRVGNRIAAAAKRDDYNWEFNVVAKDVQNAFALPGGKVVVYEGMLPVCQSEAGLAVVMSHEVAHALARHGGERMAAQKARQLGSAGIDLAGRWLKGDEYDQHQEIVQTVYNVGTEYAGILPYSRSHESEADKIGLKLMAMAGYDPSEAPKFWERFAAAKSGNQTPEFLSTHPSDARRAAELRERVPEALQFYEQAPEKIGLGEPIMVESTNITLPLNAETRLR
ncbi:MAG: M48 family metallopeptidase [Planctomycetota bacterium]|jgi:predicted Zn-dependent protease